MKHPSFTTHHFGFPVVIGASGQRQLGKFRSRAKADAQLGRATPAASLALPDGGGAGRLPPAMLDYPESGVLTIGGIVAIAIPLLIAVQSTITAIILLALAAVATGVVVYMHWRRVVRDLRRCMVLEQVSLSERQGERGDEASSLPGAERSLVAVGVTHELRTPLTILKGRLHGIEDGVISPDGDEAARLLRQVEHVLEIVNDLDMLAQADLGRLTVTPRAISFSDTARAVVGDLRLLLARHEMEMIEIYEDVHIHADPVRLTQIITNLLTNASKHSAPGGRITVTITCHDGEARLSVLDEGPGFTPGDEERLFTPFWRSAATIKRAGCLGTGMGLALTARLVEAHGGKIFAENRKDRSGACFQVILPASDDSNARSS